MTRRPRPAQRPPRRNRYKRTDDRNRLRPGRRLAVALRGAGLAALVIGLAAVFILIHDLATQSRTFTARRVTVIGNRHLTERAVMRQAGAHPGVNILAVRLGPCRRRLLAHPWIARATVRRRLPDAIELRIVEHLPLAVAEMPAGRLLIDRQGRPFKRCGPGDPERLPVIQGLAYADLPVDGHEPGRPFVAALSVLRQWLTAAGLPEGAAPPTLSADPDAGLTLASGSPLGTVVLGFDHYPRKLDNLRRLLENLGPPPASGWQRIDLTHLQRIVIRPSKEA